MELLFNSQERQDWFEKRIAWKVMAEELNNEIQRGETIDANKFTEDNKKRFDVFAKKKKDLGKKFNDLDQFIKEGKSDLSYLDYLKILTGQEIELKANQVEVIINSDLENM